MPGALASLEAILGTPLRPASVAGEYGIAPEMFAAIRRRADQRRAQDEARKGAGRLSTTSKIVKSVAGAPLGPAGMAEPWVGGRHPAFDAGRGAGFEGVYGQAGSEADARVAALQGRSTPGYVRSTSAVGGMVPVTGAGRGLIGEQGGISPLGAGRVALETALSGLGLSLASPAEFAAGSAGSAGASAYERSIHPDDRRAQFLASLGGGLAGGVVGGAFTPEGWKPVPSAFGDALDKIVNAPGAWIRPTGTGVGATVGRAAVNALPSTGSVTGDLLGRLMALRHQKQQRLLGMAFGQLPRVPGTLPVVQNPYAENPYAL